jgi:hypothetical protein
VVDRLESVLTKFYFAGEGPEWQAIWDQVHTVLGRTTATPVDRCRAATVTTIINKITTNTVEIASIRITTSITIFS